MLDSDGFVLAMSPSGADARLIADVPPALLKIDGFIVTLGLSGDANAPPLVTNSLPGVFVGDRETGNAKAADTC